MKPTHLRVYGSGRDTVRFVTRARGSVRVRVRIKPTHLRVRVRVTVRFVTRVIVSVVGLSY